MMSGLQGFWSGDERWGVREKTSLMVYWRELEDYWVLISVQEIFPRCSGGLQTLDSIQSRELLLEESTSHI